MQDAPQPEPMQEAPTATQADPDGEVVVLTLAPPPLSHAMQELSLGGERQEGALPGGEGHGWVVGHGWVDGWKGGWVDVGTWSSAGQE